MSVLLSCAYYNKICNDTAITMSANSIDQSFLEQKFPHTAISIGRENQATSKGECQ